MTDHLAIAFPRLAARVPKLRLADLPTPLLRADLHTGAGIRTITIKNDGVSGRPYGGNKIRKLEYLLCRARGRNARRVATFGTAGSNHALATAVYAKALGLECTCLVSHQPRTPYIATVLEQHLGLGTELVPLAGRRAERVATMRRTLQNRGVYLIPAGGSNWIGALGFVNAGLEIADQLRHGEAPEPDRLYVANGTMGTVAGLALGLALAGLGTEVHAIRVTPGFVASPRALHRLVDKTATVLRRLDPAIPADLATRIRLSFRDEFFAGGYTSTNAATDEAVATAREALGIELETTYTGKAMAALLHDLQRPDGTAQEMLFWNTYNARPLQPAAGAAVDRRRIPEGFERYFD
jgi:D-cysteine desulfhydrase